MRRADPAPFWASLPFAPTGAQRRAVDQILEDMAGPRSMNRLLQGDVGSGKTLVAAAALWAAVGAGYQGALLAPTELLAQQHAETLNRLLAPFGIRVALLTGGLKAAARRTTLAAIRAGEADLVVGTHAILSEGVEFARLGLAVIDEQHRFGVRQRGALAEKGASPHLLVMSATPIPRTLGLLIYGDLDISILDELPPGRTPVKTRVMGGARRRDLYGFLDREIGAGRQVYIVCPAIEEGPDGGLAPVKTYYEQTAKALLPDRRVGLMHGKLKPKEKAAVMEDFRAGRLDALVSTTVIEVGGGCAQRHRHGDRERRALRPVRFAPAAGPGGPGRSRELVLPGQRQHRPRRPESAAVPLFHHRRLCGGPVRPGDPRPRRLFSAAASTACPRCRSPTSPPIPAPSTPPRAKPPPSCPPIPCWTSPSTGFWRTRWPVCSTAPDP